MTPDIEALPFDQLRTLHREIAALIAQKRHETLMQLREQAAVLGFTANELLPSKNGRDKVAVKYKDDQGNTWSGRGKRPAWLVEALDQGRSLEDFAV